MSQYELRAFTKNTRGKYVRVKTLTIRENDAHSMAVEVWRLTHLENPYRIEVRDLKAARGKLAPLVTYEELLTRSKGVRA
jgi:hypothetical protein